MNIAEAVEHMIDFYEGDFTQINHTLKVWSYAKTIGELEGLDGETQRTLELAAIAHDTSCPYCRKVYGNASGKHQEEEGPAIAREFYKDAALTSEELERICYLIGHHHSPNTIDGIDYQILIEADYIVNAEEMHLKNETIESFIRNVFKTAAGIRLIRSAFQL